MSNKSYNVEVQSRVAGGTAVARRMRREGMVPAVIYGYGKPATSIAVDTIAAGHLVHHAGLLALDGGDSGSWNTIVKEVQRDPITGDILHIDFLEVNVDEVITATVRIEPHGEPRGASKGGQLEQLLHEFDVNCKPADMIEVLVVDVSGIGLGENLHVSDLVLPDGLETATDGEIAVFQVREPRMEVEEPEPEEGLEGEEGTEGAEGAEGEENAEGEESGDE